MLEEERAARFAAERYSTQLAQAIQQARKALAEGRWAYVLLREAASKSWETAEHNLAMLRKTLDQLQGENDVYRTQLQENDENDDTPEKR